MRKCLSLSLVYLLTHFFLSAQDYQPFRNGLTYEYRYGDYGESIMSFRVDTAYTSGPDSVFYFQPTGSSYGTSPLSSCPLSAFTSPILEAYYNHLMFQHFISRPGGVFLFVSDEGDTFSIRTQEPALSSWTIFPGITATMLPRSYGAVLGVPDSLAGIALSTGDTIRIHRTLGLSEGIDLRGLIASPPYDSSIALRGIPELLLGEKLPVFTEVANLDIGDSFDYVESTTIWPVDTTLYYLRETVISKYVSAAQDTFQYSMARIRVVDPEGPFPPYYLAPDTVQYLYTLAENAFLNRTILEHAETYEISPLILAGYKLPYWNSREMLFATMQLILDSCNMNLENYLDADAVNYYGDGLGLMHRYTLSIVEYFKEMLCYRKGADSAGACIDFDLLVRTDDGKDLFSAEVYPNPSTDRVRISLSSPVSVAHYSITGVSGRQWLMGVSAQQEFELDLSSLPPGLYLLRLEEGGRQEVKKLIVM